MHGGCSNGEIAAHVLADLERSAASLAADPLAVRDHVADVFECMVEDYKI